MTAMTTAPDGTQPPSDGAGGVESGAATLRAGLTSLLQEHVYLAGAAIATAVGAGGDMEAPAVQSAVATLDENSVALSEAVASVYGDAGRRAVPRAVALAHRLLRRLHARRRDR